MIDYDPGSDGTGMAPGNASVIVAERTLGSHPGVRDANASGDRRLSVSTNKDNPTTDK